MRYIRESLQKLPGLVLGAVILLSDKDTRMYIRALRDAGEDGSVVVTPERPEHGQPRTFPIKDWDGKLGDIPHGLVDVQIKDRLGGIRYHRRRRY